MRESHLMNNIMYGCARAYNAIHQSPVLNNVRAVFPNRINTFAGMQCSATRKCKSFAQTLPLGGSGNQTRLEAEICFHSKPQLSRSHVNVLRLGRLPVGVPSTKSACLVALTYPLSRTADPSKGLKPK